MLTAVVPGKHIPLPWLQNSFISGYGMLKCCLVVDVPYEEKAPVHLYHGTITGLSVSPEYTRSQTDSQILSLNVQIVMGLARRGLYGTP